MNKTSKSLKNWRVTSPHAITQVVLSVDMRPDICWRLLWAFMCNILIWSNYRHSRYDRAFLVATGQADSDGTQYNANELWSLHPVHSKQNASSDQNAIMVYTTSFRKSVWTFRLGLMATYDYMNPIMQIKQKIKLACQQTEIHSNFANYLFSIELDRIV